MTCTASTSGLTFSKICAALTDDIDTSETTIRTTLESDDPLTTRSLLALQVDVQIWSLRSNLASSIVRSFGDTLRGIIQKIS